MDGWINYSCKVISYKIKIPEIGYCGSKPITDFTLSFKSIIVKEKRVYGS